MQHILVLCGGSSSEREVSLRSGAAVIAALTVAGYRVAQADPADADFDLKALAANCDVVLLALHGASGEDGFYQKQLEAMGKPFLGSGSAACALTLDKSAFRDFVTARGVRMAAAQIVNRQHFNSAELRQAPYVLKPIDGGSSVDTVLVRDMARQPSAAIFDALFSRHEHMILEQLIEGQELAVGVLGDQALAPILIIPPEGGEFDYENKYNGLTQEVVNPPQIAPQKLAEARALSLQVHQMTGCRHLSRTDMILSRDDGELYVLELNTLPGMTNQSLFPKAAANAGYDMPALMKCFVDMALGV